MESFSKVSTLPRGAADGSELRLGFFSYTDLYLVPILQQSCRSTVERTYLLLCRRFSLLFPLLCFYWKTRLLISVCDLRRPLNALGHWVWQRMHWELPSRRPLPTSNQSCAAFFHFPLCLSFSPRSSCVTCPSGEAPPTRLLALYTRPTILIVAENKCTCFFCDSL